MIPTPERGNTIPYFDQLIRQPAARAKTSYLLYVVFAVLAVVASWLLSGALRTNGTLALVREAIVNGQIDSLNGDLRRYYTGISSIDKILVILVTIFLPAISSNRQEQPLQLLYFLASMLPLIAIFTIEGYRQKNKWSLIASPGIWGIMYQLRGIGFIAPLYFAASLFVSRKSSFFVLPGREVPAGKFIMPALVLGYMVPTALLFFPFKDSGIHQRIIAAWQPVPVLVSAFTYLLAKTHGVTKKLDGHSQSTLEGDIFHLRTTYQVTGVIAACMHLVVMIGCLISPDISLTELFIPGDSFAQVETLADGVFIFFQNDFLLVTAASLIWSLVNVADIYRSGLSNVHWQLALGYMLAGFVTIGPGATTAALWYWREEAMSRRKTVE